jgi:hypothetical protein
MGEVQKHNSHCLIKEESLLSSNHQPVAAKHGVRSRTNNPFILLLLSLIFLLPTLNAQIKIEERVEIAPESYNYVPGNPVSSHTIRVDMQWTPGNYDASGHCYTMPCENIQNGTGWETGGNLTFTLDDVKAGLYEFQFAFNPPYYLWVHAEYQAYLDEQLFRADTFSIFWTGWTGGFPYYNFGYSTPLRSDFRFSGIADENCAITFTTFNIIDTALCEDSFLWNYKTEPLNLTIISGGEYASFYNIISGQKIGESFSGLLPEIDSIMIGYDNPYLGSGETSVVFQCEWGSKIKTKTVRLLSQLAEQIVVESWSGNEVNTGEEIYVNVYPLNSSDCYGYFSSPGVTYNVEIVSGNQYGNLIDAFSFNNERVQSITGLEHLDGFTYFIYTADGVSANSLDSVKIRVSTTDPSIPPTDFTVYIKPSPIYAYTVPEVLGADDSADVIIKYRDVDGTLYDFPSDQTFELAVLDGCVNGNFMVNGVIDVYFAAAQQPIKFVTADSIDTEFDKVLIRVGTDLGGYNRPVGGENGEEEKKRAEYESKQIGATGKTIKELRESFEKMIAERKVEAEVKSKAEAEAVTKEGGEPMFPVVSQCALDNPTHPYNFKFFLPTKEETIEILLGETKYFAVKKKEENGVVKDLKIVEIETNYGAEPVFPADAGEGWTWITQSDVWPTEPVTKVEGKIGVYWEIEKPVWNGNVNGNKLKKGFIRVVGKYWEEGKNFKVKLTAKMGSQENSINLAIKKPNKIESNYNISKYKKNVFNEEFNLDSLIFIFAGKYGIPPQITKAQMMRESSFRPAYRYEPFPDATGIQSGYRYKNNRYKIISNSNEGYPSIPSSHINVRPHEYWGHQGTIWEFFYNHSSTLNKDISFGSSLDIYPRKNSAGDYVWFEKPADEWKDIYDKKYKEKVEEELSEEIAIDSALTAANFWLRYTYCDGIMNTGIAQTRMSSSYGFLQITYYTALERFGYVENDENYPEKLNEINAGTDFSLKTLVYYMNKELGTEGAFDDTNWKDGLEIAFRYGLSLYNGKRSNSYGRATLNESRKFRVE